jgi:hydrogenase maturation protease
LTENNNTKTVKPALVIGAGNEYRCDDAAGIIAARILKGLLPDEIIVAENDGDGAKLMDLWNEYENVIIIDAVSFGTEPGTIHNIDANRTVFPKETSIHSSHMFSIAEAIETSRALNKLPEKITVYGIEGKSYEFGSTISDEVSDAIEKVVSEIQKEVTK